MASSADGAGLTDGDAGPVLAWIDGGLTDSDNAEPLCKAHNLGKEHVAARRRRRRPPP